MNTKWKIILLVMLITIGICGVFIALFTFDSRDNLKTFVDNKINSILTIVHTIEETKNNHYRNRIKTYASLKGREKTFRAFVQRDRDELLRLSVPYFKAWKKEDPSFATFAYVTPDNHAVLRVHYPTAFGDNLSKTRPDVAMANKEHQQYSGYAVGKVGLQYGIVQPVSYEGQHVGIVHFGLKGSHFLDVVHKKLSIPVGMAIPKNEFPTINQSKIPFFVASSHTVHSRQIDLFQQDSGSIDWSLKQQKVTLQGRTYIIANAFNFLNYNQEQQGYLFVALDITKQEEKLQSRIILILISSGALLLLSFLIINSSYGALVQKIISLNQSLEKNNRELENKVHERTAKLQKKEQFQQALLDDMVTFVAVLNPSGAVIFVNNTPLKVAGLELEDVIGKMFYDAPWWTHSDEVRNMIIGDIERCASGESMMHDVQIQIADGSLMWIEFNMHPIFDEYGIVQYLIPEGRDITDRKGTEDELYKFKQTLDQTSDCVFMFSPETLQFFYLNQGAIDQVGYQEEEILTMTPLDIQPLFTEQSLRELTEPLPKRPGSSITFETQHRHKDGHEIPVEVQMQYLVLGEENGRFVSVVRDMSKRKEAEEEKKMLQAQVLHSQKLESVGQLAAGIAHEINTPAQFLSTNIDFLGEAFHDVKELIKEYQNLVTAVKNGEASPELLAALEESVDDFDWEYLADEIPLTIKQSKEGVERISIIVRAMKEFSHPGNKNKAPVNINDIINTTVTVASNEWKYVAELETDLAPDIPSAICLADEMGQVFLNIIVNAAHAIGDKTGDTPDDGKGLIRISSRLDGEWIEIRIQDNGTGMSDSIREHIFDPFFTTKEVGKGTGQGLAIAHSVITDKHEGSLTCESEEGVGTSFVIRLPIAA